MRNVLFTLFVILVLTGCEQKITDAFAYSGVLEVSETDVRFNAGAYSKTIEVEGVINWEIDTSLMENWCQIDTVKNYRGKEYITVFVDSNEMIDNRESKFLVISGTQEVIVNVTQIGNVPQMLFSSDSLVIGLDTNLLKIDFITNVEYQMSLDGDWFQVEEEDYQGDKRLLVMVSPNSTGMDRKGEIRFKHKNGVEEWIWSFRQLHVKSSYDAVGVDKLNPNLKVLPESATASSESEGKGIEKSYDGDDISYFQSTFQNQTEYIELEYRFDGVTPIDYICYVPYEGDVSKSFKTTEIWVEQDGGQYELIKTHVFSKSGRQIVVFENTIEKLTGMKFVVKSSYDNEDGLIVAACSEMEFYTAGMRYTNIFADPVYSSLQNGVTLDKIFAIEDPVFRNIAYHLFQDSYDEGRIMKCYSYPDVKANYLSFYGSYGGIDNVTGISVRAGDVIPIFAHNIKENIVYVVVFNPENPNETKRYPLYDGVNKITMDYDGHLYIRFTSSENKEIDIHIAAGDYNGYYDLSKGDLYLSNTNSSYIDLVGNHAHLLFKKEHILGSDLATLVTRYDKIVNSQQLFMGLEKYEQMFDNRVLFLERSNSFDIKYQNSIVECPETEIANLTDAEQIKGKTLWDLAVAVGTIHNHKLITWKGVVYATPKLFALATQQAFEEASQASAEGWYLDAFSSIVIPEKKLADLPDNYYDYPEKIVPFWQLKLYATEVLGIEDFYMDVLYEARKKTYSSDYYFIKFIQNRLELDLTSYLKKWGFGRTVSNSFEEAPAALVFLTPNNVEEFKKGNTLPSANGYTVRYGNVTIDNPQNVVAYLVKHTYIPMQVFDVASFKVLDWKDSMRIYALGIDGTEVELPRL